MAQIDTRKITIHENARSQGGTIQMANQKTYALPQTIKGVIMSGREKDRKLHRRQRRHKKLRKLQAQMAQTKDLKTREKIEDKIKKISVHFPSDFP